MTTLLFCVLLLANLVLLVFQPGDTSRLHEPARLQQQLHAERISLTPAVPKPASTEPACVEIGNFTPQMASAFESRLSRLSLPALPQKHYVTEQGTHMVYLPPQNGQAGAARKLAQLRQLGWTDLYLIQDQSARRWGISLGLFKSAESAQAQLALAEKAGVTGARVEIYPMTFARAAYQLRNLDSKTLAALDVIRTEFAGITSHPCEPIDAVPVRPQ
jgi:hypothetical protein